MMRTSEQQGIEKHATQQGSRHAKANGFRLVCQRGLKTVAAMTSLIALLVNALGCATIVQGRSQDIPLASTPPGAMVKIDGVQTTTPGKVTLRRDQSYNAVFEKQGYPPQQAKLESTASWWLLGNLIFGGLIGLVIDLAAGGGYKLVPAGIDMELQTGVVKEIKPAPEAEAAPSR